METAATITEAGTWVRDATAEIETWRRHNPDGSHGYVAQWKSGGAGWQAWRGGYVLSGGAESLQAAKEESDRGLALPLDIFNATVGEQLVEEIRELEVKLYKLCPRLYQMPGYRAGYEAGKGDTRRRIEEALA